MIIFLWCEFFFTFLLFYNFSTIHNAFTIRENNKTYWKKNEEWQKAIKGVRNRLKIEKDVWRTCLQAVFLKCVYSDIA